MEPVPVFFLPRLRLQAAEPMQRSVRLDAAEWVESEDENDKSGWEGTGCWGVPKGDHRLEGWVS